MTGAEGGVTTTFAASKFAVPVSASRHLPREPLVARLEDGGDRLRVVIASPGAGKSTLLADWYRRQRPAGACWVNVDEGDRNQVRFWRAFITAVQQCAPGFGDDCLDLLRLDATVDHEFLERLLAAMGALAAPVTVIVDDLHLAGGQLDAQLRFLVNRGTERVRIAIGTRAEPEIGLQRMRLLDRLCELREADLRFDRDEAKALLDRLDATVSQAGFEVVMQRTEGWAAGLHLTALVLRDANDPRDVVERLTGTHQVIAHYLWSEVFTAQRDAMQRFLLDTCVADELSPGLAAALSPNSTVTLLDIEAANLLCQRVDPDGSSFRYHHLLIEMLRGRLRVTDPGREATLHERAAQWFDDHRDPVAAFRHRWHSGHHAAALQSMDGTLLDVVYDALPVVSDDVHPLSDDDIRNAPGPALNFAVALVISGSPAEARALARRIQSIRGGLTAAEQQQLLLVEFIATFVLGDVAGAIEMSKRMRWGQPLISPWESVARTGIVRAHVWQHEFDDAEQRWREVAALPRSRLEQMELDSSVTQLLLFRGDLTECMSTARRGLDELGPPSAAEVSDGLHITAVLGTALLETGQLAEAEAMLRPISESHSSFRIPALVIADVALSRLWAADGNIDAARVVLDDAYRMIRERPRRSGMLDLVRTQHAHLLLQARALDAAEQVIGDIEVDELARELLAAELAIGRGDLDQAATLVCKASDTKRTTVRARLDVELARLRLALATGNRPDHHARAVFDVASTHGFVFPLVELGVAGLTAVQDAARRRTRTPFVDTVTRLRPRIAAPNEDLPHFDLLTERERAVLRYMATSLSYTEIARELYVSRNTIKTHVKNVQMKLGVTSRQAALARARVLHYL